MAYLDVDVADVKPSLLSWATVGIMAITFIAFIKWALSRWPVKGISDVVAMV